MALFNYATKEITIKVVYYGPGLSGKTTNLQYLHTVLEPDRKGKLLSLATETDRTLFFDFMPVEFGKIKDFSIRFQLYTVPGQVRYNATRKLVLKGADAIIFVADSQYEMRDQNIESLKNMRENLIANNIKPDDIPVILQYNKRDLLNIMSINELNEDLNEGRRYEYIEAIAINGVGVEDAFQRITQLVIDTIAKKYGIKIEPVAAVADVKEKPAPKPPVEEPVLQPQWMEQDTLQMPEPSRAVSETVLPSTVSIEKLDDKVENIGNRVNMLINRFQEISDSLKGTGKEISEALREINEVIRDIKEREKEPKEKHETNALLRDIKESFEKLKTKKRWFSFF